MSRKNGSSQAFGWRSKKLLSLLLVAVLGLSLAACEKSQNEEIEAAKKFSDAVTRNEQSRRDSMIATWVFKQHFANTYVEADNINWFRSFYNYQEKKFFVDAKADVERDFTKELQGGLIDTNKVEETGLVKVKSPVPGKDPAVFWMVKQTGKHWRVAMVTHGDAQVNFH